MSVKTTFQDLQEFGWTKAEILARAQAHRGNSAQEVHLNDHKVSHEYNWSVHNALKGDPVAVATRPIVTTKITHTHFYDNSANVNGVTLAREESWEHEEVNVVNVTSHAHVLLKEAVTIAGVKIGVEANQPASSKKVTPETVSYQVHVAAGESVEWTVVKTITGTLTVWEQSYGPQGQITSIGGRYKGHYYHGFDVDHLLDTPRGKLQLQSLSTKSDNDILIKNKVGPETKSSIVITHIVPHPPSLRALSDYLVAHDLRSTLPSRVTWVTKTSPIASVGRVVLTPPAPPPPVKHPQVRYTARAHIGSPNILAIGRSLAGSLRSHGYSNTSSHVDAVHCTATFTILLPDGKTANNAETLFRTVLKDVKDARFLEAHAVKILVVHADGFEDVEDIERHSSEWEHFHSGVKNQHHIHYDLPLVKYTGKATFPSSRVLTDVAKQMTHLLAHRGYNETKPAIDAKNHSITYVITVPIGKTAAETDVAFKSVVSVWEHARVSKSTAVKLYGILEDGFQETSDIDLDSYDWNNFRSGAPPQHHHALKYEGKASFSSHTALEHAPAAIVRYLATQGYLTASTPAIDQKHLTASFVLLAPGGKSALDAENTFIHALSLDSAPKSQHGEFIRGTAHKQIGTGNDESYEELDRDSDEWVYFRSGETHAEQNRHSRSLAASSASTFTQNNVLTLKYTAKASFPASAGSLSALALLVTRTLTARGFTSPITSSIDTRHNTSTFVITLPNGKTVREAESAFKQTVDRDTIGGTWVHGSAVKVFVGGSNGEDTEEVEDVVKGTDEWDTLVGF